MRLYWSFVHLSLAFAYLKELPPEFRQTPASWAWVSYTEPSVRVIEGPFNRSIFSAPSDSIVSDPSLQAANLRLNDTNFITYDPKFFDLIGPHATITKVQNLTYQVHEAPCYNPRKEQLFFTEWGPPGGVNGQHPWQFLLDVRTNKLRNITTNPPLFNAHGCVFHNNAYYVVNDGSPNETATLSKIDPNNLGRSVLLNNYYEQPFISFNDLEIDPEGNFWITDSLAGSLRHLNLYQPPTRPTLYFVNGTTMRPQALYLTDGNTNGVAVTRNGRGQYALYASDTGSTANRNQQLDPYSRRDLTAFDYSSSSPVLRNRRLLNNPISYFYDGVRVSRNGYIFGAAGKGVDIIDPNTGLTLGTIRVGGGRNVAVNFAFGEHEMWIVGYGGVWHVKGIHERLDRDW